MKDPKKNDEDDEKNHFDKNIKKIAKFNEIMHISGYKGPYENDINTENDTLDKKFQKNH